MKRVVTAILFLIPCLGFTSTAYNVFQLGLDARLVQNPNERNYSSAIHAAERLGKQARQGNRRAFDVLVLALPLVQITYGTTPAKQFRTTIANGVKRGLLYVDKMDHYSNLNWAFENIAGEDHHCDHYGSKRDALISLIIQTFRANPKFVEVWLHLVTLDHQMTRDRPKGLPNMGTGDPECTHFLDTAVAELTTNDLPLLRAIAGMLSDSDVYFRGIAVSALRKIDPSLSYSLHSLRFENDIVTICEVLRLLESPADRGYAWQILNDRKETFCNQSTFRACDGLKAFIEELDHTRHYPTDRFDSLRYLGKVDHCPELRN